MHTIRLRKVVHSVHKCSLLVRKSDIWIKKYVWKSDLNPKLSVYTLIAYH